MSKKSNQGSKNEQRNCTGDHKNVQFRKKGIYYVTAKGARIKIADPILVTAFATSDPGTTREQAFTEIKFLNRRNEWKKEIVSSSMLTTPAHEFISLLSKRGYIWPANPKDRGHVIGALSVVKPARDLCVTFVPGWHGQFFALPDESYSPDGPNRNNLQIIPNPTVRLGEFRRSGTLEEWHQFVGKPCLHSSRARLAIAANFAAPILRMLGLNSFGFNFSGVTTGGKTLLLRWATSASGLNSAAGPATWDGTPTNFEQRALGHRDCIMPLDDVSYLEGDPRKLAKFVTFRLSGNRPKGKAGEYVVSQNLVETDWRVISLSTSEDPLWDHTTQTKIRQVRGEEVRMIDIPACVSEMQDIFDGPDASKHIGSTVEQRRRFVEEQEQLTQQYQGEAFRAYVAKLATDKYAQAGLKAHMDRYFKDAPLPKPHRWLGRIQRMFSCIYAGAALAIEYGILPWGKRSTLKAIRACMNDAMHQLIVEGADSKNADHVANKSDKSLLADFKRYVGNARFVRLDRDRGTSRHMRARLGDADGIIRTVKPGRTQCLLFGRTLDTWFPDVTDRRRVTRLNRSRGVFGKGRRPDTSTRQIFVAEIGSKVPCYVLSRKKLRNVRGR
jgi:Domain of unknown function (DUF927)